MGKPFFLINRQLRKNREQLKISDHAKQWHGKSSDSKKSSTKLLLLIVKSKTSNCSILFLAMQVFQTSLMQICLAVHSSSKLSCNTNCLEISALQVLDLFKSGKVLPQHCQMKNVLSQDDTQALACYVICFFTHCSYQGIKFPYLSSRRKPALSQPYWVAVIFLDIHSQWHTLLQNLISCKLQGKLLSCSIN